MANVKEIFDANPATTLQSTDLFYLGRDPYGAVNDMACEFSTILDAVSSGAWTVVASGTQSLAVNNGYITNNGASLVTYTLPGTAAVGSIIEVAGKSTGLWTIEQNGGQTIFFGEVETTPGTGGSLSAILPYDYVKLLCITANTEFSVIGASGDLTVV